MLSLLLPRDTARKLKVGRRGFIAAKPCFKAGAALSQRYTFFHRDKGLLQSPYNAQFDEFEKLIIDASSKIPAAKSSLVKSHDGDSLFFLI